MLPGKEIMNGKPDLNKGSYYANATVDQPVGTPKGSNPLHALTNENHHL